jgi:predicted nucleic acid-binding protein
VVLDTNVLIKAFENTTCFKGFFELLKDCDCDIVDFDLINFEFTRNDFKPEIIDLKEDFLKKINAFKLQQNGGILKEALEIAKVYSHQGIQKGQISLVDCCLGALLKQYGEKLFLATSNHSDFPLCLFDREYILPIDAGNEVISIAFYRFNNEKWEELKKALSKVKTKEKN